MKYIMIMMTFPILMAQQCNKKRNGDDTIPACISQKIEAIKSEPKWNPPAQVDEYIYNGQHVFLFSLNCCDKFNVAYDENCKAICAPSGGYAGIGDRKCLDFFNTAKFVKLVWKDPR